MTELAAARRADAARMAARLADVIDGWGGDSVVSACAFLRDMAASAPLATPAAGDPLQRVVAAYALAPVERDLVVLAGLPEEHEGYASVLRVISPAGRPYPTAGLAAQLLCADPDERAWLRDRLVCGPAARAAIVLAAGNGPLFERDLVLATGLWEALVGIDGWPPALACGSSPAPAPAAGLAEWLDGARPATSALATGRPCTVLVAAETAGAARGRASALAAHAGVAVALFDPLPPPELAQAAAVNAVARAAVPLLVAAPAGESIDWLRAWDAHPGPVIVAGELGQSAGFSARPVLRIVADRMEPPARRQMWRTLLPELAETAGEMAARHPVEPAIAEAAASDIRLRFTLTGARPSGPAVTASLRARAGAGLAAGVALRRARARWEDLVLPAERLALLHNAVDRLTHQSRVLDDWGFLAGRPGARGVRLLLAGPPGTGKTLAAEVMATAVGADLLTVDLSSVVSKWLGDTEKNLAQIFAVAEQAQAVLLFDEADALFGRRTEVSDARDRYANLETAYLLTRLEQFEGLAVLATNLRQNIDAAFTRRLEFVVEFDEPTPAERLELWRHHLPTRAPLAEDVSLEELAAGYGITGSLIRNAAAAAGFLAAANGQLIDRAHLLCALHREYEKSGRAFPGPAQGANHEYADHVA